MPRHSPTGTERGRGHARPTRRCLGAHSIPWCRRRCRSALPWSRASRWRGSRFRIASRARPAVVRPARGHWRSRVRVHHRADVFVSDVAETCHRRVCVANSETSNDRPGATSGSEQRSLRRGNINGTAWACHGRCVSPPRSLEHVRLSGAMPHSAHRKRRSEAGAALRAPGGETPRRAGKSIEVPADGLVDVQGLRSGV